MSEISEFYPPRRIEQYGPTGSSGSGFMNPRPIACQWDGTYLTTATASQNRTAGVFNYSRYSWTLESGNPKTSVDVVTEQYGQFTIFSVDFNSILRNDHVFNTRQNQSGITAFGLARWYNFNNGLYVNIDVTKVYHPSYTINRVEYYYSVMSSVQTPNYIYAINGGAAWPNTPLPHVNRYGSEVSNPTALPNSIPDSAFNLYTDGYLDPIGDKGGTFIDKSLGVYSPTLHYGDDGRIYVVPYRGFNPNTFVNGVHALILNSNCTFYRNVYFRDENGDLLVNGMSALETHIITANRQYWCHSTTGGFNPSYFRLYELVEDDGTNLYYQYRDRIERNLGTLRGTSFTFGNNSFVSADGLYSLEKIVQSNDFIKYNDPDTIFTYIIGEDRLIPHTLLVDPDVTDYHCINSALGLNLNDVFLPAVEKYTDIVFTIGFHNGPLDGNTPIDYTHHENVLSTFRTIPNISISNLTMTQSKYPDDGIRIRTIEGDDGRKSIVIDGRYVTDNSLYEFRSVKKNENCETGTVIITDIRTNIPKNLDPYLIERKPNQSVFTVNVEYSKTDTPNCVWSETFNVIQPYIETGQETQEFIRNYLYGEPFTEIEIPAFADSVTQGKTSNNNTTISNPCGCKK